MTEIRCKKCNRLLMLIKQTTKREMKFIGEDKDAKFVNDGTEIETKCGKCGQLNNIAI